MNSQTRRTTAIIITLVLGIVAMFYLIQYRIDVAQQTSSAKMAETIVEQERRLLLLAETTRINGADDVTERIIKDCGATQRQRFDTLLDRLSGTILPAELDELNTLFYQCGSFYADRKAVMATRLIREVEILAHYHEIMSVLKSDHVDAAAQLESWKKLAEAELKTAEYFKKLVQLQGDIITQLNTGKTASSPEVVTILNEVNSVRGQMLILKDQIEVHKSEARSL